MISMTQIFDVTANKNTRYKRNELESLVIVTGSLEVAVTYFMTPKVPLPDSYIDKYLIFDFQWNFSHLY